MPNPKAVITEPMLYMGVFSGTIYYGRAKIIKDNGDGTALYETYGKRVQIDSKNFDAVAAERAAFLRR